jgi:small subunit ribosomal protein S17
MITRNLRKERIGIVTSNSMNKSIVVSIENKIMHGKYGKFVKRTSKFITHDEKEECNVGDTVKIMETRPLSKNKCWRLVEIVERAK